MSSQLLKFALATGLSALSVSCATSKAWVVEKNNDGGRIGYAQKNSWTPQSDILRDFDKIAEKVCGKRKWKVVREIIPQPTGYNTITSAMSGDARDTVNQARAEKARVDRGKASVIDPDAPVEYGSFTNSWNEAEIKCL
jgi:hypothetical protein